jgi:hypothetical protein
LPESMLKLSLKQIKVNFDVCIEETLRQCLVTLFPPPPSQHLFVSTLFVSVFQKRI